MNRFLFLIYFVHLAGFSQDQNFFHHFTSKVDSIQPEKYYLVKFSENPPFIWSKKVSTDTYILKGNQIDYLLDPIVVELLDNGDWRFSESAFIKGKNSPKSFYAWQIITDELEQIVMELESLGINILRKNETEQLVEVFSTFERLQLLVSKHPAIRFIGEKRFARSESILRKHDLSVNGIYKSISVYGKFGSAVGIKEQAFNLNDIDLKNIAFVTPWTDPGVSAHATDMATLVGGKGVLYVTSEGVSNSTLFSTSFNNLMPDPVAFYTDNDITVQNHSYGVGIENFYGPEASAFDSLAIKFDYLNTVFSSGNQGQSATDHGNYEGVSGYATLTGEFKQSKNSLIVGAIDSIYRTQFFSSTGPAYDGRIKPELVAFGGEGSSDAAAVVSGAISYLQGAAKSGQFGTSGNYLPNTVIKSVLIASADDLGEQGPDFVTGYGNLNLYKATQTLKNYDQQVFEISFPDGLDASFISFAPSANLSNVRIALVWNDLPARPNDAMALIANLDVRLYDPIKDEFHYPWVLNAYPHPDSLRLPAKKGIDNLNVVELISIEQLQAGNYSIEVSFPNKNNVNGYVPQAHLAISYELPNNFEWTFPLNDRPLIANTESQVRWTHNFGNETGALFLKLGEGAWLAVESEILLENFHYNLLVPDTTSAAQLRMDIAGHSFYSEIFGITPIPSLRLHVNCSDSLIFKWNKIQGINQYLVIPEGDLGKSLLVSDTVLSIAKADLLSNYYGVTPVFESKQSGNRSYSINYILEGTGCYLDNFLVSKGQINQVILDVKLSGISEILNTEILKIYGTETTVYESFLPTQTQYLFQDYEVGEGITKYQLRLTLADQVIESEQFEIALARSKSILYPNPVEKGDVLSIINSVPGALFQLIDSKGQPVLELDLVNDVEYLPLLSARPGLYTYRILVGNKIQDTGKLIIQ